MSEYAKNSTHDVDAHAADRQVEARRIHLRSDRRDFPYPRRVVQRAILKGLAKAAWRALSRVRVSGRENLPAEGPYILAANHFHFSDPAALLCLPSRQVEFVGGFRFPNAPWIVKFLPSLWGYFPVHRGAFSRASLDYSVAALSKGAIVGIFPEGGSWARVLRPPRGGIGYLAVNTGLPVVPVSIIGNDRLFRQWRPHVQIEIGKPIDVMAALEAGDVYRDRKAQYEAAGEVVMREIARLVPQDQRGIYSDDPQIVAAAQEAAIYPFDQKHMRGM